MATARLLVDVARLLNKSRDDFEAELEVELEPFKSAGFNLPAVGPARIKARVSDVGAGVMADGRVAVALQCQCSRCLGDMELNIEARFRELFAYDPPLREEDEEERAAHVDGGNIDLYRAVRDAVGLSIPLVPLCRDECKGLCPVCGADLNDNECRH